MKLFRIIPVLLLLIATSASCLQEEKTKAKPFDITGITQQQTDSDLKYYILETGTGTQVENGLTIAIDYSAYLTDGTLFDSSVERGYPFTFVVGAKQVIQGLDEGVKLLSEGAKVRFVIPPQLAYGDMEYYVIPANSTVIYDVEVLSVEEDNKLQSELNELHDYLVEKNISIQPTDQGMYYIEDIKGEGNKPEIRDSVKINYIGYDLDSVIFDTNIEEVAQQNEIYDPARTYEPIKITIGKRNYIPGLEYGLLLMNEGSSGRLIIPSYLAYGKNGRGSSIPPYTTLIFQVELLELNPQE